SGAGDDAGPVRPVEGQGRATPEAGRGEPEGPRGRGGGPGAGRPRGRPRLDDGATDEPVGHAEAGLVRRPGVGWEGRRPGGPAGPGPGRGDEGPETGGTIDQRERPRLGPDRAEPPAPMTAGNFCGHFARPAQWSG